MKTKTKRSSIIYVLSICFIAVAATSYNIFIRSGTKVPMILWFLLALFLWVMVVKRIFAKSDDGLEAALTGMSLSSGAVTGTFDNFFQPASVTFNPETSCLYFINCHVPHRFLAMSERMASCSIDDVYAVYPNDRDFVVVTSRGKATIPWYGTSCQSLYEHLKKAVPENKPGFAADNPIFGYAIVGLATVGVGLGALLAPRNADVQDVALFMISGGGLAVVILAFLVRLADRTTSWDIVKPIAYSMKFGLSSLLLGVWFSPFFHWDLRPMIAFVVAGMVVGCFYGLSRQK